MARAGSDGLRPLRYYGRGLSTGAQDSYFISLYLLAILMGSILFTRRGAFLVAGASFLLLGCVLELSFYGIIPQHGFFDPEPACAGVLAGQQFFRIFRRGLSGQPAGQTIRKKGVELDEKREELKDLQRIQSGHYRIHERRPAHRRSGRANSACESRGSRNHGPRLGLLHGEKCG